MMPSLSAPSPTPVNTDEKNNRVIGAIQLINKADGKASFTELDELFMAVYANMCVSAFLACEKHTHITYRTNVLQSILEAPKPLLALLPDTTTPLFVKDILPSQVLKALEDICRVALRCVRVKAFLCSDMLRNMEKGYLIALDAKAASASSARAKTIPLLKTTTDLGAAGYVIRTRTWYSPHPQPSPTLTPTPLPVNIYPLLQ